MAEYEELREVFAKRDVLLITASVDPVDEALSFRNRLNLSFPVGYGLDGKQVAELLGGFYDNNSSFLNPSAFLLNEDDTISVSVYSSASLGRLVAADALSRVEHLQRRRS